MPLIIIEILFFREYSYSVKEMFRNLLSLHNRRIANSVMEKDPQPSQEDPRIFLRFKNPVSFQIPGMLLQNDFLPVRRRTVSSFQDFRIFACIGNGNTGIAEGIPADDIVRKIIRNHLNEVADMTLRCFGQLFSFKR